MYQRAHYSGIEYLANNNCNNSNNFNNSHNSHNYNTQSSANKLFYAAVSSFSSSYNDGMFIPSRDAIFSYSSLEKEKSLPYSVNQQNYTFLNPKAEYHFIPEHFLKPGKEGLFVGRAEEVREFVEEVFEKIFHQPFPNTIKLSILNQEQFRKIAPSPGTIGLSLNRSQEGLLSEVFVLNDSLGRVMLTIGHELGHVLTASLSNVHHEEAKAYAFSLLWMEVIKEHDIANLGEAIITEHPANNGLHDLAFALVVAELKTGKSAQQIYGEILTGDLAMPSLVFD